MNAEDRDRQLDRWLDEALARYSDVEPRAGLEQRILSNLRTQPQRRPWWQWAWIPVAAAVLIAAGVLWMTHPARPDAPPSRAEGGPPLAEHREARVGPEAAPSSRAQRAKVDQGGGRPHRPAPQANLQVASATEDLPRQEVFPSREGVGPMFPSPAPLNTQELALIHLVKRDPEEVRMIAQEQEADRQRLAKMFEETGVPRK